MHRLIKAAVVRLQGGQPPAALLTHGELHETLRNAAPRLTRPHERLLAVRPYVGVQVGVFHLPLLMIRKVKQPLLMRLQLVLLRLAILDEGLKNKLVMLNQVVPVHVLAL